MNSDDFLVFVEAVAKNITLSPKAIKYFKRLYKDKILNLSMHTGRLTRESKDFIHQYRCMQSELRHHAMRSVMAETCVLLGMGVPDYLKVNIPTDVVTVSLPKSKSKFDDALLDDMFGVPHITPPSMAQLVAAGHTPTYSSTRAIDKQRRFAEMYGAGMDTLFKINSAQTDKDMADYFKHIKQVQTPITASIADLEKRMATDFFSMPTTEHKPNRKEKPMDLKVTRPVLVGTTNILTAQTFELDSIIREAQLQIKANEDLQELSQHHKNMKAELEEVIRLCVKQLDKGLEKKESLFS